MASRLVCHNVLQHLRSAQKHMLLQHRLCETLRLCTPAYHIRVAPQAKWLHVKVFDKDAGLETQREANRHKKADDRTDEGVPDSKPHTFRQRRITRLVEQEPLEADPNAVRRAKEELVLNSDADTFGNAILEEKEDPGDILEEKYTGQPPRRERKLRTIEYARLIKDHMNAHRLKDAIEVLEKRMKEDRVQPDHYIYNLLISGCAKAGYTRKAFSLFTKMRQRGLKITGGTYTSLFNACANAPSPVDGLSRANHLREIMLEKGCEPNAKNYNAMIKAYGRCGDVKTAFLLADEMMERRLPVNTDTFNFLLQACASDAEYGFRHCLLTWHKMLDRGLKPDYYTFNAVLRCVRDCKFGDLEAMEQVLQQIVQRSDSNVRIGSGSAQQKLLPSSEKMELLVDQAPSSQQEQTAPASSLQLSNDAVNLEIPNLLLPRPHLGSLVSIAEVSRPHERFLLLGGLSGYFELMKQHNVTPNIETCTTVLEVLPPTNSAEKQLLTYVRRIGLKADIDFFNVLIKKRAMRFDYEGGKEVLSMIRTAGLAPDIITYGVLALGCQTADEARELLQQMRTKGIRLNTQILGAMLHQGCASRSFPYVVEILQISLDENVKPNEMFLRHLHKFYNQCARAIDSRHPSTKSKSFRYGHSKFCDKLRLYYEEQGIAGLKLEDAIQKIRVRPYQQYKEEAVVGAEPTKNEQLARKQKLRKYIKKIKIDSLRDDDDHNADNNADEPKGNKFKQKTIE